MRRPYGPMRFTAGNGLALAIGLAFLYGPIVLLVAFSFNASRLVTVWGGFSTRWYLALLEDEPLRDAAWITVRVAFLSAALATALGTAAAFGLVRRTRPALRAAMTGLTYAPMVMPEVITGLSLLLFFVAIGLERGFWTVVLAHTTMTTGFVTVVVQARLIALDPALSEAAAGLGAAPLRVFRRVTLPLIAPSVLAGFLLAATLSLDDLVVASFTSGPGATTLPMRIYSQVRLGVTPEINAAATILLTVSVVLAGIASKRGAAGP